MRVPKQSLNVAGKPYRQPQFATRVTPQRRLFAKLSRNASCWCGSNKKYKRCHYQRDRKRGYT